MVVSHVHKKERPNVLDLTNPEIIYRFGKNPEARTENFSYIIDNQQYPDPEKQKQTLVKCAQQRNQEIKARTMETLANLDEFKDFNEGNYKLDEPK